MMAPFRFGLKKKIILSILFITLVPLLLGLYLVNLRGTTVLRQSIGASFVGLAKEAADKTDISIEKELAELQNIAEEEQLYEAVLASNARYVRGGDIEAILTEGEARRRRGKNQFPDAAALLRGGILRRGNQALRTLTAADAQGALIGSSSRRAPYRHSQERWWQEMVRGRAPYFLSDLQRPETVFTFNFAVPIYDPVRGERVGALVAEYDVDGFLKPFIHEIRFGRSGHAMLLDSAGTVLTCPILPTGSHVADLGLVRSVTAAEPGWIKAENDAHGGHNSIVGFSPVLRINQTALLSNGPRWHSFIRQDPEETYAPIRALQKTIFISGLLLAGVITAGGGLAARRLVKPIQALHEGVQAFGHGELGRRIEISTGDEIEALAVEFNEMAAKIGDAQATLEQKVTDRTGELSTLIAVATTVNRTLNLQEVLDSSLAVIFEMMRCDAGFIRVLNPRGKLELKAARGVPKGFLAAWEEAEVGPSSSTVAGRVAALAEPIVIVDPQSSGAQSILIRAGFTSLASVPILSRSRVVGTLTVASRTLRRFSDNEVQLLASVGNQIGTAIENATLYQQAQESVKQLKELDRLKTEFLSNVSHEMRTPLTSIIGFSEILLDQMLGEISREQEEVLRGMNSSGYYLLEIINNLLDLSKIKAGKMEVRPHLFDFSEMMRSIDRTIIPLVTKKSLVLETEIDPALSKIYLDEAKLKQALLNLLSNAVKFTPSGGHVKTTARLVEVDSRQMLECSVSDTGIGISAEALPRIFEEFQQVDASYTREYAGTGLGLAITKKFVEMMGGEINIKSKEGEGSIFSIVLPFSGAEAVAAAPPSAPSPSAPPALVAAGPEPTLAAEPPEGRPVVLVVEDDPTVSRLIALYLIQEGYRVEHAADGEEAIEKAREIQPFAITLDIMLPRQDGWEVLRKLKALSSTRDIPVIIVSIIDNPELGFSLGAIDYLTKPIDRGALIESLRKYARKAVARKPITVVLIDSDEQTSRTIREVLEEEGFGVIHTPSAEEGTRLVVELQPDVLILDLMVGGIGAFEAVRRLKDHPTVRGIPIILATSRELTQPEKNLLEGQIREVLYKGSSLREDLKEELRRFEKLYPDKAKMIDGLTGLFNERYLHNRIDEEVRRALRYRRTFSIVQTNIDGFRSFNRRNGTEGGDAALKEFAELLLKNSRASNALCRCGGSTIAIILTETDKEGARMVGEKFRGLVEAHRFLSGRGERTEQMTISCGVATFFEDANSAQEILNRSFRVMEEAAGDGGNRVRSAVREE